MDLKNLDILIDSYDLSIPQGTKEGNFYHWANSLDTFRRIKEDPECTVLVIRDGLAQVPQFGRCVKIFSLLVGCRV
jgi:hypothetical protein